MGGYGTLRGEIPAGRPGRTGGLALRIALASSVLAALALAAVVLSGSTRPSALLPKLVCGQTLCEDEPSRLPAQYEPSFSIFPESYDQTEAPTMFNGADPSGNSWRQYVPMLIWPDEPWFDEQGNYLGRGGVADPRKATVTKQIPDASGYMLGQLN